LVDLVLLQPVSYVVMAIGICVAVVFYALNLREIIKNRRVKLTNRLMQALMSEEGNNNFIELMNMEWKDIDEFNNRYDSGVNPENFSKRMSLWSLCESIGYLCRINMIDLGMLFAVSNSVIQSIWVKFKPVIYDYRKTEFNKSAFKNFEYLVDALNKVQARIDVSESDKEIELAEHESMRYRAYSWWPQNNN